MPKNKGKGGKAHRRGKNETNTGKRELIYAEEGQVYGLVQKMLGGGRMTVSCYDNVSRLVSIRGSMRKKVWISAGDTILVSLRDFEDDKADAIHKYNPEEVKILKDAGELPEDKIERDENANDESDDEAEIEFGEQDIEDI